MTTTTIENLKTAVRQLAQSGRGKSAMRHVLDWLDDDGLGLDRLNQDAIFLLLDAAWGPHPGTARDLMREALEESPPDPA